MNKLETITQLLVNELTDFEKNVQRLGHQMERAESLRVKFDVSPIKSLISQLEVFGRRETERREQYLDRLERNLQQAKIYPKWAVITFTFALILCFGGLFYGYNQSIKIKNAKNEGFEIGVSTHNKHINRFFEAYPQAKNTYEQWCKDNESSVDDGK